MTEAIDKSLYRMKREYIDLLQFHWWDYSNKYYYNAMDGLMHLQQLEKISNIGLTNFDTTHMKDLIDQDAPIVSNQVSYSILDTRPSIEMEKFCVKNNVKLLCYGVLLGGFLSSKWLGVPEPNYDDLKNVSLRKYLPWIRIWGGWGLFQQLLMVLNTVAKKHDVSISTVAMRWILDQPAVGAVLIGNRFGMSQQTNHIADNAKVFSVNLDEADREMIREVQSKSNSNGRALYNTFGDCGGEYRYRR